MNVADDPQLRNLVPAIRSSLNAKLERLLARPIVGRVVGDEHGGDHDDLPPSFRALQAAARSLSSSRSSAWREDPNDGTCTVRISIDYEGRWRGCEKEVRDAVANTVEGSVTFLTEDQKTLLERSPRQFLESCLAETSDLVGFDDEVVGGAKRVVELTLAAAPASRAHIQYVAVVPNLVQLQRQLRALHLVETASDDGPLRALRALVGLSEASRLGTGLRTTAPIETGDRLDEHQRECVMKAISTPHFAVVEGPPGSGKTTIITAVIREALARGERVLVVSPTHVAVDNVVEKLVSDGGNDSDHLEPMTLPVRYAGRDHKLSARAKEYWVGTKKQTRPATISRRVEARLSATIPFAAALYEREDTKAAGRAPLSAALAHVESVICGTPIGILSFDAVKNADVGAFGLLIVDEVSKMTMPEFLAIAVKARRWIVVGDPAQLPPYNDNDENGTTLDDLMPATLELACSVACYLEWKKPHERRDVRLVVVSSAPARAAPIIRAQVAGLRDTPEVGLLGWTSAAGILVCSLAQLEEACELMSGGRTRREVKILVEQGVEVTHPPVESGRSLVEPRRRAPMSIFETSFNVYHAQPWATQSGQRLQFLSFRNGLQNYLPAAAAIELLSSDEVAGGSGSERRHALVDAIATRFAINTVSVYDWLTDARTTPFDVSPLRELSAMVNAQLIAAVQPFVGTLKKQYRMHESLSRVPRELFYLDKALFDGFPNYPRGCLVDLVHVEGDHEERESNRREVETIAKLLRELNADESARRSRAEIMVITPYRKQEAFILKVLDSERSKGGLSNVDVDVFTLERCQGREADYVLVSLVRDRTTPFLDMPKRWNVALTRAKKGLFIVGNVDAYLAEAARARAELRDPAERERFAGETRPRMSVLARIIEAYDRQLRAVSDRREARGA